MKAKILFALSALIVLIHGIDMEEHITSAEEAIVSSSESGPATIVPKMIPPPKPPRTFAYKGPLQSNVTQGEVITTESKQTTITVTTKKNKTIKGRIKTATKVVKRCTIQIGTFCSEKIKTSARTA